MLAFRLGVAAWNGCADSSAADALPAYDAADHGVYRILPRGAIVLLWTKSLPNLGLQWIGVRLGACALAVRMARK
jgi:hypothetical protein